jgi:hypothetical protein
MKLLFIMILFSTACLADDITTLDGKTYKGVTILSADPDGLRIMYESGATKVQFTNLSKDVQAKYHYDAVKDLEFKNQEKDRLAKAEIENAENKAKKDNENKPAEQEKQKVNAIDPALKKLQDQLQFAKNNVSAYSAKYMNRTKPAEANDPTTKQITLWNAEVNRLQDEIAKYKSK